MDRLEMTLPEKLSIRRLSVKGAEFSEDHQRRAWSYLIAGQGWSMFPAGALEVALRQTIGHADLSDEDRRRLDHGCYRAADRMLQAARKAGVLKHVRAVRGWAWSDRGDG